MEPPPIPKDRSAAALTSAAWRLPILGLSIVLYVIACALPAIRLANGDVWPGYELLLFGAFGAFFGQFAWFANLLYALSLICLAAGFPRLAAALAAAQCLLALDMLGLPGTELYLDEGGVNRSIVVALLPAAGFWFAALAIPALIAAVPKRAALEDPASK